MKTNELAERVVRFHATPSPFWHRATRSQNGPEALPSIDGNVAANWRQRLRPLFETAASLGETRNRHLYHAIILLVCRLRKACEGCPICQIFSSLAFLVPRPFECSSSISRKPPCRAVNFSPHSMSGFSFSKNKPEVHCLQGFGLDDFAIWKSVRAWRRVGLRQLSSACGCGAAQSGRCRGSGGSRAAG